MPFFEGAQHFIIKSAEMNDVKGDYNRNETNTNYNNRDVGNHYTSSVVNRGNTDHQNFTIGGGSNNVLSVRGGRQVNGYAQLGELQSVLQSLPQMLSELQELPGVQATQTSTVTGSAVPRSVGSTSPSNAAATPALAAQAAQPPSAMLNMLGGLPANSWTPQMRAALDMLLQASNEAQGTVSTEGSVVNTDQRQGGLNALQSLALSHASLTQSMEQPRQAQ